MTTIKAVEIEGQIKRLRTMADGTVDLTIALQENSIPAAGKMLGWVGLHIGGVLELRKLTEFDNETKKGAEGKPVRVDRRRLGD